MISAIGSAMISTSIIFYFSNLSFVETMGCLGVRGYYNNNIIYNIIIFLFANLFPFFLIVLLFLGPVVNLVIDGEVKEQFFKGNNNKKKRKKRKKKKK